MSDVLAPSPEYAGRRVEFAYKAQGPVLAQYIASQAQRSMIMGPLGSGKTNASCWKAMKVIREQAPDRNGVRKVRGCAVRNTYPDLFGTTIKDWMEMFGDPGMGQFKQGGKEPPTHYLNFRLPDKTTVEAELVFMALDREEHVKKLRGFQGTFGWANEVKELAKPIIDMLDLRMGRYPQDVRPSWYGIFGDTNAPDQDHWYYRLAEEMTPEGWAFFKQPGGLTRESKDHPWVVNPLAENILNLPPGYYLKGAQGKTDNWISVNLANRYGFVGDGLPVWADYVDEVHCKPFELVPGIPIDIGLDFGLTPAAIIGQQMPNGQWRWRYEVVTTDTGIARFAGILKAFIAQKCRGFKIRSITGDPAGDQRQVGDNDERTVFQLLAANGVVATPAPGNNDFTLRMEAVAKPLRTMIDGHAGLVIHDKDMPVTRKGMQGAYKFRRLKVAGDERYQNEPVKNAYSHPCFVAGTMIATERGQVPIETLRVGDWVSTPIGPRRVVANMRRPVDALVDVAISTGVTLRCTPDHPFALPAGGFIRADALQSADPLVSIGEAWAGLPSIQSKNSMACATTASQAGTSRPTTSMTASTCTGQSGNASVDRYQPASTFTTRTRIQLTALWATWSCVARKITAACMGTSETRTNCAPCLPPLGLPLPMPTGRWQAPMQPPIAVAGECSAGRCSDTAACSARVSTRLGPARFDAASAVPSASKPLAAPLASTTSNGSAPTVASPSQPTSTPPRGTAASVAGLSPAGSGTVYNLEVAEAHCYYAGGVLVSNCEAGQYLMLGNGEGEAILMANPEETKADAAAYRQERALPTDDEDQARDFRRNRGLR